MIDSLIILRAMEDSQDLWESFSRQMTDLVRFGGIKIDFSEFNKSPVQQFREVLDRVKGVFWALSHGTSNSLDLVKYPRVIDLSNASLLEGSFCYLVACDTGLALAQQLVKKGAKGVVGFSIKLQATPTNRGMVQKKAYVSGLVGYLNGGIDAQQAGDLLKTALRSAANQIRRAERHSLTDPWTIKYLEDAADAVFAINGQL